MAEMASVSHSTPSFSQVATSPLDYSNDSPAIITSYSALVILSTVFVALRFWSKRLNATGWQYDDWLVMCALFMHHGFTASCYVMVMKGGFGRDIRLVVTENPNSVVILFKVG